MAGRLAHRASYAQTGIRGGTVAAATPQRVANGDAASPPGSVCEPSTVNVQVDENRTVSDVGDQAHLNARRATRGK
jgi:hypothetical protein